MTLAEAAQLLGMSVDQLKSELKLPPGTPPTERLSRLSHEHDFTMEQVRELGGKHNPATVPASRP